MPSVRVHPRAPRDQWRAVLADDPLALPEHTPEWVDAVCAVGPFTDATRLYEFADRRRFVLPLVRRSGPDGSRGLAVVAAAVVGSGRPRRAASRR